MKLQILLPALLLVFGASLSSCSVVGGGSAASEVNSSNPAIAAQAQKVVDLENQVKQQQQVSDAEKTKLDGLKQQLKGSQQNLKGVKTQAKAG